jgi:hypothetical protein
MKRLLAILALTICVNGHGAQQQVTISRGFFVGKDYFEMNDTERRAYVTGAINGMLIAPLFGAPQERVDWLKTCSATLSDEEIAAILTRYINLGPNHLSESLNVLTFYAMKDACQNRKKP